MNWEGIKNFIVEEDGEDPTLVGILLVKVGFI